MNIGIFDSGIGGMTLLHQAMAVLPLENYIFYADTDHVPYGTKSKEQVIGFVDDVMRFMLGHDCKAVVIACNTATAVAAEEMRNRYAIPIIGIEPAVKPALAASHGKRVLVAATPLTVREKKLKELVERVDYSHLVDLVALPRLVELAEHGDFDTDEVTQYLQKELSGYDLGQYGEFVLGCTHFNFFKDTFRKLLPADVKLIDGSEGTIRHLKDVLAERGELKIYDSQSFKDEFGFQGNIKGSSENGAAQVSIPYKCDMNVRYFYSGRELTSTAELEYMRRLHERLERMHEIF